MSQDHITQIDNWKVITLESGKREIIANIIHPDGSKPIAFFNLAGECTFYVDWSGYQIGRLPAEVTEQAANQIAAEAQPKVETVGQKVNDLVKRPRGTAGRRPVYRGDNYFMKAF